MSQAGKRQQEIASQLCNNIAVQLKISQMAFDGGGEQLTLNASAAMVGVAASAISLGKFTPGELAVPNADQVLFTCLYIANSASFHSDGGLLIEFDIANVIKTLEQFEAMTHRSFEPMLDPSLLDRVNETRTKAQVNGDMSKFLPN